MINYFIPISLMVFAGFTLGLLVGRMAWGTAQSGVDRRIEQPTPRSRVETPAIAPSPAPDQPTPDLPVWQMKEVRSRQRLAAPLLVIEADHHPEVGDDPDAVGSEPAQAEIAPGGTS